MYNENTGKLADQGLVGLQSQETKFSSLADQGLEMKQPKRKPEILASDVGGWEAKMASKHGFTYALTRTALDFLPYVDLIIVPSVKADFMRMDQQEQTRVLLWEALDAALWGKAGALKKGSKLLKVGVSPHGIFGGAARDIRYLGGGISKTFGTSKRAVFHNAKNKFLDTEAFEALGKAFNYSDEVDSVLKKTRFRSAERKGIKEVIGGGTRRDLYNAAVEISAGEGGHSKAWKRLVNPDSSGMYPGFKFSDDLTDVLSKGSLYKTWKQKTFKDLLETKIAKIKLTADYTNKNFKLVSEKLFGKGVGIDDVDPETFKRVLGFSLRGGKRSLEKAAVPGMGHYWVPVLKPVRFVLGQGEKFFGTYSNIYRRIKNAAQKTNQDYFNKTILAHKFFEDAGLGKLIVKKTGDFRFKPIKSLTKVDTENAFGVLQALDNATAKLKTKLEPGQKAQLIKFTECY